MTQIGKTYLLEEAPIPKAAAQLCIPTVISALIMACYSLADTYFVGLLNDPTQNAAVTLASPALMLFDCSVALFGGGAASLISRSLGKKDYDTVSCISAVGIWLGAVTAILVSLLFVLFQVPILRFLGADESMAGLTGKYLKWTFVFGAVPYILYMTISNMVRAEGSTLQSSIGVISGCVLNIILDPFFVMPLGLGMGAEGAGCASFLSHCFSCLYFMVFLGVKRQNTFIRTSFQFFRPSQMLMRELFSVGIPALINKLLTVSSQLVLNNTLAQYGPNAVAAMGIAFRVDIIPLDACFGLSQGIMPLIGYNYASGNTSRMEKALKYIVAVAMCVMTGVVLTYWLIPEKFIGLFIADEIVTQYGAQMLRGMCLALPLYCYSTVVMGVFQACGMGSRSLILSLSRQILMMIPSVIVLDKLFGMFGIAYSYFVSEVAVTVIASLMLKNLFA